MRATVLMKRFREASPLLKARIAGLILALVVLTISWRLAATRSHNVASSSPEISGPGRLNLYSTLS